MLTLRIDPVSDSYTKRRLVKSPKYLFFDLGVRRACANEGTGLPKKIMADLFEHYVGNELVYQSQLRSPQIKVRYWRDTAGPEIDYVLDVAHCFIPIEVKWTDTPDMNDARHLKKFMDEYPHTDLAYIVCQTPHRYKLNEQIMVLPWQDIHIIFELLCSIKTGIQSNK